MSSTNVLIKHTVTGEERTVPAHTFNHYLKKDKVKVGKKEQLKWQEVDRDPDTGDDTEEATVVAKKPSAAADSAKEKAAAKAAKAAATKAANKAAKEAEAKAAEEAAAADNEDNDPLVNDSKEEGGENE